MRSVYTTFLTYFENSFFIQARSTLTVRVARQATARMVAERVAVELRLLGTLQPVSVNKARPKRPLLSLLSRIYRPMNPPCYRYSPSKSYINMTSKIKHLTHGTLISNLSNSIRF